MSDFEKLYEEYKQYKEAFNLIELTDEIAIDDSNFVIDPDLLIKRAKQDYPGSIVSNPMENILMGDSLTEYSPGILNLVAQTAKNVGEYSLADQISEYLAKFKGLTEYVNINDQDEPQNTHEFINLAKNDPDRWVKYVYSLWQRTTKLDRSYANKFPILHLLNFADNYKQGLITDRQLVQKIQLPHILGSAKEVSRLFGEELDSDELLSIKRMQDLAGLNS